MPIRDVFFVFREPLKSFSRQFFLSEIEYRIENILRRRRSGCRYHRRSIFGLFCCCFEPKYTIRRCRILFGVRRWKVFCRRSIGKQMKLLHLSLLCWWGWFRIRHRADACFRSFDYPMVIRRSMIFLCRWWNRNLRSAKAKSHRHSDGRSFLKPLIFLLSLFYRFVRYIAGNKRLFWPWNHKHRPEVLSWLQMYLHGHWILHLRNRILPKAFR